MSSAPLVGLVGPKRVGKDSVAAVLCEWFGFRRFAFADALRRAALVADPFIVGPLLADEPQPLSALVDYLGWEGLKSSKYGADARQFLQNYGMAIREMDPNFWLRQALSAADDVRREGIPAVITDVRFTNEADQIEREGGILVRVIRPGLETDGDTHVSETELATRPTPYTVVNAGTLEDLRETVFELHEAIS
jgi:hypothetical protein